jgi:hypothetical protein
LYLHPNIFTGEDMTQDEIIEMARQAGFEHIAEANYWHPLFAKFAELVAQHEREACIELTDSRCQCAWVIRARGKL